jgi:ATP-dependent protease ClpP protease subunit
MVKSNIITVAVSGPGPTPATITASASNTSPTVGQNIMVSGNYLDSSGGGISGATLYLFINGVQQGTTTTGAGGAYSFTFSFASAGTYQVNVADNTGNA